MTRYLTNRELAARGLAACPAGFEVTMDSRGRLHVAFWLGFYNTGTIIDRTTGAPAICRVVGRVWRDHDGYAYRTHPGSAGAVRYGRAATEDAALLQVARWLRRRFAHCTPLALPAAGAERDGGRA